MALATASAAAEPVGVVAVGVAALVTGLALAAAVVRRAIRVSGRLIGHRPLGTEVVFGVGLAALAVRRGRHGRDEGGAIHLPGC